MKLSYLRTGNGPALVLLHGLMGSGATWTPVARALAGAFDVVMPDARGHAGSDAPPHGYRYDALAGDVVGLIGALQLERPMIVGHSMGGLTAAVVASRALLRGLVLVDPTFLSPERQREVYASDVAAQHRQMLVRPHADRVAEIAARHPHRSREMIELLADARARTSPAAFEVLAPPNPDYRELMRAVAVPTLLVIGDQPVVTPELAGEVQELNPLVRVAQVADAGHGLPFDQPERLAELIAEFHGATLHVRGHV